MSRRKKIDITIEELEAAMAAAEGKQCPHCGTYLDASQRITNAIRAESHRRRAAAV
jgi:DNA repair exonuclease SbcCD ATPase subunit